jgi:hypothetical protein
VQHTVDHRVLRKKTTGALGVGQENYRARDQLGQGLHLMEELLELPIGRRRFLRGHEPVHHEQRRFVLLDGAPNQGDQRVEASGREGAVAPDVIHAIRNRALIEKRHPPQVRKHSRMGFGQQRYIQCFAAG